VAPWFRNLRNAHVENAADARARIARALDIVLKEYALIKAVLFLFSPLLFYNIPFLNNLLLSLLSDYLECTFGHSCLQYVELQMCYHLRWPPQRRRIKLRNLSWFVIDLSFC
jgi:hypothetical protein